MFDVKGYFSERGDEYTLTTPKTRSSYRTALINNMGYCFEMDQFGMGRTYCRFKFTEENNITDKDRTIYFRDDETNDLWCASGSPYVSKVENFKCTHKQSNTVITSEHNGIRVTVTTFVPLNKRCDIQTVKIENLTDKPRTISLFPAIFLSLTGFKAPTFCRNFNQSYLTEFKEKINGLYINGRNPYSAGKPYNAYLSSTTPVYAYSADCTALFGSQPSLSMPIALMDGEDLDSKSVAMGKLCFMLQTKAELPPYGEFETDYILGIAEDFDKAKDEVPKSRNVVSSLLNQVINETEIRRNKITINTPHQETNNFINYWLKLGIECQLIRRRAPRDNLQFSEAAITFVPDAVRFTIINVIRQQYKDGHIVRMWMPLNETLYADAPGWLVSTTCSYIKYTNDFSLLDEVVEYFDGGSDTVWNHLLQGVNRMDADRGPHNLTLSHYADWNDALNTGDKDKESESVFVAMQLALAFREMAELSKVIGKGDLSKQFDTKYEELKNIINETCWDDEGYYIRSFADGKPIGSSKSEKGSKIYTNPQAWSIISGVCSEDRVESVLENVDKHLDTNVGCLVNTPAYTEYDSSLGRISYQYPGTFENGAVYSHATGFKMYADCILGLGDRGYGSYLKILPSNPEISDSIPYNIVSCCSTADVCYGKTNQSVLTTGTMAWVFRTVVEGFLGLRFTYGGFNLCPAFPSEWDRASLALERNGTVYNISIVNNNLGDKKIFVNGKQIDGDFVPFTGDETLEIKIEL